MSDSLVERLLAPEPRSRTMLVLNGGGLVDPIKDEAAAEITRLQEALAAAAADAERSEQHRNDLMDGIVSLRTEVAALRTERAETREKALKEARPIIEGLLTAYLDNDEDGLTEHAEPIIAARAFLRALKTDEVQK